MDSTEIWKALSREGLISLRDEDTDYMAIIEFAMKQERENCAQDLDRRADELAMGSSPLAYTMSLIYRGEAEWLRKQR